MRILHVLHDFLPAHVAGVEVYTDHLSQRQALHHDVALLFSEVVPEQPNYALRRGRRGRVATYEIVNNHRFRRFEETYRNPAIDQRVREVLDDFRPDVVHVQHLLNLSLDLLAEVEARALPIVMTLHDHWLACANGGQRYHRELGRCEVLDAARCGACTAHLHGVGLGLRGILRRRRASAGGPLLRLADVQPLSIDAPRAEFVYRDMYRAEGASGPLRPTWVAHPPARLRFRVVAEGGGRFAAGIALHPDTFEAGGGGVRFRVVVNGATAIEHVLDPKRRAADRRPAGVQAELPPGESRIELVTEAVPAERNEFCTAGWIDPQVAAAGGAVRAASDPLARALKRVASLSVRLPAVSQARRVRSRWEAVRRQTAHVDAFVAPSRYLGDELVRFGLPPARVVHCDYGFVTEPFTRRRDLPPVARHFAFIGSLVQHKGVHVLLQAFDRLPPDARLTLCGAPHYEPAYFETLERMARHPGVRFIGALAPERVPAFLAEVDCLVVPSVWCENSPLTIHEAFLAGVPVVASRLGGHVELLAEGGGLVYDADDPASLGAALCRLYDEPGLGRRLAESAPPVKPMKEHVAELLSLYEQLVGGTRGRA